MADPISDYKTIVWGAKLLDDLTGGPMDYEKMKEEAEAQLQAQQAELVPEVDVPASPEELSTE